MPDGQPQTIQEVLAAAKDAIAKAGGGAVNVQNGVPVPAAHVDAGTDYVHFGMAVVVLIVLTLLLPPQYGKWLPFLTILAFGANNTKLVDNLLNGKISAGG